MSHSLSAEQLGKIQTSTVGHYEDNAASFREGTKDHDVSQNYNALLSQFEPGASLDILDFGCGPGRDVGYFKSLGHRPVGLDGSDTFCKMVEQHTGCDVICQGFLQLDLPAAAFDAVFANASLFHVPRQELPGVLAKLHTCLRPGGILFTSNPRGTGEQWYGERYGNYQEFDEASACLQAAGFTVLSHYYRPKGMPKDQQPWLAIVSRRV